jgi:hypothetical protein
VLKGRNQLQVLLVSVNAINKIEPCAEGQVSAAGYDGYFLSYNTIVPCADGHALAAYSAGFNQSNQ